jgi:hypothetical protein
MLPAMMKELRFHAERNPLIAQIVEVPVHHKQIGSAIEIGIQKLRPETERSQARVGEAEVVRLVDKRSISPSQKEPVC